MRNSARGGTRADTAAASSTTAISTRIRMRTNAQASGTSSLRSTTSAPTLAVVPDSTSTSALSMSPATATFTATPSVSPSSTVHTQTFTPATAFTPSNTSSSTPSSTSCTVPGSTRERTRAPDPEPAPISTRLRPSGALFSLSAVGAQPHSSNASRTDTGDRVGAARRRTGLGIDVGVGSSSGGGAGVTISRGGRASTSTSESESESYSGYSSTGYGSFESVSRKRKRRGNHERDVVVFPPLSSHVHAHTAPASVPVPVPIDPVLLAAEGGREGGVRRGVVDPVLLAASNTGAGASPRTVLENERRGVVSQRRTDTSPNPTTSLTPAPSPPSATAASPVASSSTSVFVANPTHHPSQQRQNRHQRHYPGFDANGQRIGLEHVRQAARFEEQERLKAIYPTSGSRSTEGAAGTGTEADENERGRDGGLDDQSQPQQQPQQQRKMTPTEMFMVPLVIHYDPERREHTAEHYSSSQTQTQALGRTGATANTDTNANTNAGTGARYYRSHVLGYAGPSRVGEGVPAASTHSTHGHGAAATTTTAATASASLSNVSVGSWTSQPRARAYNNQHGQTRAQARAQTQTQARGSSLGAPARSGSGSPAREEETTPSSLYRAGGSPSESVPTSPGAGAGAGPELEFVFSTANGSLTHTSPGLPPIPTSSTVTVAQSTTRPEPAPVSAPDPTRPQFRVTPTSLHDLLGVPAGRPLTLWGLPDPVPLSSSSSSPSSSISNPNPSSTNSNVNNASANADMGTDADADAELERPPYAYHVLMKLAILGTSERRATLQEMLAAIRARFPFYARQSGTERKAFENSIRHLLSLLAAFVRLPKPATQPGKGAYWTVDFDRGEGNKRVRKRNTKSRRKAKAIKNDENEAEEPEARREESVVRGRGRGGGGGGGPGEVAGSVKGGSKNKGKGKSRAQSRDDVGVAGEDEFGVAIADEELGMFDSANFSNNEPISRPYLRPSTSQQISTHSPSSSSSLAVPATSTSTSASWQGLEQETRPSEITRTGRRTRSDQTPPPLSESSEREAKRARTSLHHPWSQQLEYGRHGPERDAELDQLNPQFQSEDMEDSGWRAPSNSESSPFRVQVYLPGGHVFPSISPRFESQLSGVRAATTSTTASPSPHSDLPPLHAEIDSDEEMIPYTSEGPDRIQDDDFTSMLGPAGIAAGLSTSMDEGFSGIYYGPEAYAYAPPSSPVHRATSVCSNGSMSGSGYSSGSDYGRVYRDAAAGGSSLSMSACIRREEDYHGGEIEENYSCTDLRMDLSEEIVARRRWRLFALGEIENRREREMEMGLASGYRGPGTL